MKNITPQELHSLLHSGDTVTLIDVRTPEEYQAGHIAGSQNMPLNTLPQAVTELKDAGTVYVNCAAGGRSMQACDIFAQNNIDAVNVVGGVSAWVRDGLPVV